MLVRVYDRNSMIDEFNADDIKVQDDFYFATKDGNVIAIIPKTYYIRITEGFNVSIK